MITIKYTTKELENEQWRDVPGYENYYSVSNLGRIRQDATGFGRTPGHIRAQALRRGYLGITLHRDSTSKTFAVHRLVAAAFLGPCPDNLNVNHNDGNKLNNRLTNLEYVTRSENQRHAVRLGLLPSGDRHYSKTHPEKVPRGERSGAYTHRGKFGGANHWTRKHQNHPSIKLSDADVDEIFHLLNTTTMKQREIAKLKGVTESHISHIKRKKTRLIRDGV